MRGAHARPFPLANRNCLTPSPAPHQRRKCRSPTLAPLPYPAGKCRALPRRAIDTGIFRTRTAPTAAFDLDVLSLSELKKMQNDVAKAIATFEDRHKVEARANVEASARDLGYSLAYGDPEQRTDSSGRRHGECTPERDPCSTSNNTSTASRSA